MHRRMSSVIRNRIVCVLLHGKSIQELENRIEEFQDFNVCWAGINQFSITEQNILKKINKKLDIVQDCSEIKYPEHFEAQVRIPRLKEFLYRGDNNCFLTTQKVLDTLKKYGLNELPEEQINKIVITEDYVINSLQVPNSLAIYLLYLARFGAERIILFGFDGYKGKMGEDLDTYYKSELVKEERLIAFKDEKASGLHSDTEAFDLQFLNIYDWYLRLHALPYVQIFNCSFISVFSIFPKLTYDKVKEYLI